MSNKSECDLRRLLCFGLVAGFAMWACRSSGLSPAAQAPSQARDNVAPPRGQTREALMTNGTRAASHVRPHLLPLLDAVEPSFIDWGSPDAINMAVDGIRIVLHSSGAFEIAEGTLPMARRLTAMRLPERLGGGWLFCLASSENTWLMRADSFTGSLTPIGNIEVPTSAVTPGFEGIYVTLRQSGLVLNVDPKSGKASGSERLPRAPEYGPIAIVSDQMGAYMDPLRGVMTTFDAGHSWLPLDWTRVIDAAPPAFAITSSTPIRNLTADAGELRIEASNLQPFWLSSRGNVHFAKEPANAWQSSKGAASAPSTESRRRIRRWLDQWRRGPLGGWPIEVAVTRGGMLDRRTAIVLAKGRLSTLRLRDGQVQEVRRVDVPVEAQCEAIQGERELFFRCERPHSTSLYHWVEGGRLEPMAMFNGEREVLTYSDFGIVVRGDCALGAQAGAGDYCVVEPGGTHVEVRLLGATGRERLAVVSNGDLAVLVPPNASSSGRLIRVPARGVAGQALQVDLNHASSGAAEVALTQAATASERQRAMLRDSLWLQRLHYASGELSAWLMKGDDLLGIRVDDAGKVTLGEVITGATRSIAVGDRALVPDSSGFAFESTDGGLSFRRPQLPLALADVDTVIPKRWRACGCSTVGCRLGDWLRVGWSSSTAQSVRNEDPLVLTQPPEPIRFSRPKRHIPRLHCELTSRATVPRNSPIPSSPSPAVADKRATKPDDGPSLFESTRFQGFYGVPAPTLPASRLGFDRGFMNEGLAMRAFVQTPRLSGVMTAYRIDWRVSDPLRRAHPWSSTTADVEFDSLETVARAFGHPRYGEHATSWNVLGDSDGAGLLWTLEDAGKRRYFLVEPNRPMAELRELDGREPRRITDVARLNDGWYLLGTEPNPRLYHAFEGRARLVSESDPRARLQASRLRMLKNRSQTRVGYWALSARMRSADVEWLVYPVNLKTGAVEASTAIPLASGIRPCTANEDGWVLESSVDLIADVELGSNQRDAMVRATGLFLLSESGVCVDRVLLQGASATTDHPLPERAPRHIDQRSDVPGRFEDDAGRVRDASCRITEPGT